MALIIVIFNAHYIQAKPKGSVPLAHTGLTITNITPTSLTLNWSLIKGTSAYYVYMATSYDSNYPNVAKVTSTSFIKSGLAANSTYWFYVVAYNRYITSPHSIHKSALTLQNTTTPSPKQILGFATYYYNGDTSSYNSMIANTSTIDAIATQTYTTDSFGNLSGVVPKDQINYANSSGIKTYAMVQNNFDGNIAKSVLENATYRQALENNLQNAVKTNGYKGVNVDLEGIFYYHRSFYTTFVQELYNLLSP